MPSVLAMQSPGAGSYGMLVSAGGIQSDLIDQSGQWAPNQSALMPSDLLQGSFTSPSPAAVPMDTSYADMSGPSASSLPKRSYLSYTPSFTSGTGGPAAAGQLLHGNPVGLDISGPMPDSAGTALMQQSLYEHLHRLSNDGANAGLGPPLGHNMYTAGLPASTTGAAATTTANGRAGSGGSGPYSHFFKSMPGQPDVGYGSASLQPFTQPALQPQFMTPVMQQQQLNNDLSAGALLMAQQQQRWQSQSAQPQQEALQPRLSPPHHHQQQQQQQQAPAALTHQIPVFNLSPPPGSALSVVGRARLIISLRYKSRTWPERVMDAQLTQATSFADVLYACANVTQFTTVLVGVCRPACPLNVYVLSNVRGTICRWMIKRCQRPVPYGVMWVPSSEAMQAHSHQVMDSGGRLICQCCQRRVSINCDLNGDTCTPLAGGAPAVHLEYEMPISIKDCTCIGCPFMFVKRASRRSCDICHDQV